MKTSGQLSSHILPTSATMVGVSLTVVGLAKLVEGGTQRGIIDEMMAFDSLVFLVSAFCSYLSLRRPAARQAARLERLADAAFMAGLVVMTIAAFVFAYELH